MFRAAHLVYQAANEAPISNSGHVCFRYSIALSMQAGFNTPSKNSFLLLSPSDFLQPPAMEEHARALMLGAWSSVITCGRKSPQTASGSYMERPEHKYEQTIGYRSHLLFLVVRVRDARSPPVCFPWSPWQF